MNTSELQSKSLSLSIKQRWALGLLVLLLVLSFWAFLERAVLASLILDPWTEDAAGDSLGVGLQGYWPLDSAYLVWDDTTEEIKDISGNNRHMDSTSLGSAEVVSGIVGQGLWFEPIDGAYANTPSSFNSYASGTISMWFKYSGIPGYVETSGTLWDYENCTSNKGQFQIAMDMLNSEVYLWMTQSGAGCSAVVDASVSLPNPTDWHHVVYTNDTSGHKLYIDGILQTLTYTSGNSSVDFFLDNVVGSSATPQIGEIANENFSGILDEIRIYNRALSADEVKALYGRSGNKIVVGGRPGANTLTESLVGYWPMDGDDTTGEVGPWSFTTATYPTTNAAVAGYGDGNGFQTTQGTGDLANIDGNGLYDPSSGTGNATDGCGTFPQSEDDLHSFRDFNISIPSGATIDGITVNVTASSTSTGTNLLCTALSWNGGNSTSTVKSTGDVSSTVTTYTLGGAADTWGHSWSDTEFSNANFRVYIMPDPNNSNARNFFLDALSVDVAYSTTTYHAATTTDRSGNGNNGTNLGAATSSGHIGDGAMSLDGTSAYISVTDPTSDELDMSDGTDFSLSGWFYRDTFTTDDTILAKSNGQTAADTGYNLYIDDTTDKLTFVVNDGTDQYKMQSLTTYTTSGWHHFTVVWNDSSSASTKIFIDGSPQNSTITGTFNNVNSLANSLALCFGAESDADNPFDGMLDDVRIYKRALTPKEVADLYALDAPSHPDTSLVAHYTFDGPDVNPTTNTAIDRGRGGNTGNLTNGTTPTLGKSGQALNFDGVDDYVDAGSGASLDDISTLSVCAWINPRTAGEIYSGSDRYGGIASKGVPGGWFFMTTNIFGSVRLMLYNYFSGDDGLWYPTSATIALNEWTQACVVYDHTSASNDPIFYMNGTVVAVSEDSTPTGTADSDASTNLHIGTNDVTDQIFDGAIDDVRIYNRVLSADEIATLYKTSAPKLTVNASMNSKSTSGLVGLWSFDGPDIDWATNQALDRSGNGNDGVLTNMSTTTSPTFGKIGQALKLTGSSQYVSLGNVYNGVKTVSFWVKPNSTTQSLLDLNSTATIDINAGTVRGNNFATPTIYVDAEQTSTFPDTDWHFVIITTNTGINASASYIGKIASTYLSGSIDDVRMYSSVLSANEIQTLYILGH